MLYPDFVIPEKDLLSYMLDDQPVPNDSPLFIEAEDESNFITYGQFKQNVGKLGQGLRQLGLKPQQAVLIFSPNQIAYPWMVHGIICAGGLFTGANPTYTARELAHQITHSQCAYLFVDSALIDTAKQAAALAKKPLSDIFTITPVDGFRCVTELLADRELQWHRITDLKTLEETTCNIMYSSGTTGVAKGVEQTHRNVVANAAQTLYFRSKVSPPISAPTIAHLPYYHAYSNVAYGIHAIVTGQPHLVMRKFDLELMLKLIQKHKVQYLSTVPPIIVALAKSPLTLKYDISSVRAITSGAAPLGVDAQNALRKRAPNIKLQQGWGMSEVCCGGIMMTPADDDTTGSCGYLLPQTEARLVDDDGKEVTEKMARGELWVRGPQIMKGYLRNPQATADTMEGDWLKTGDIAVTDGKWFWIVDRKKELIKCQGLQVAPAELESLLLAHPKVVNACVVGVPYRDDEAPRAYVVRSDSSLTEEVLDAWFNTQVAKFKQLRGGIVFIEAIPTSPSGKLLRRELRDQAKREIQAKL
ncbi:AMP-binding enzyme [Protomyces lactucae-debilis]|uniref:AMP-binding enzyme n=1 Tax=Protomyces lactucae-debilis TaxID=2754530 RepID=A0A1Y2FLY7_PROLT|nr:AMP-binding enzyme [Protomyces lactucae-debilis]ORY83785.1 AMP-binding enzyme [Protomyces lactucae-debilis]